MINHCLLLAIVGTVFTKNCGEGVLELEEQCAIVKKTENENGYFEAHIACRDLGGHLLSIHNQRANIKVAAYATGVNDTDTLYIGGDNHKNGVWTWIDGTKMDYTNWAIGQPDKSGGCISMNLKSQQWYATDCRRVLPYICEIPSFSEQNVSACCGQGLSVDFHLSIKLPGGEKTGSGNGTCVQTTSSPVNGTNTPAIKTTTATPIVPTIPTTAVTSTSTEVTTSTSPSTECLDTWKQHEHNCFKVFTGEDAMDYHDSQTHCQNYGGNLPSIHSKKENDFIFDLWNRHNIRHNPYIGLYWDTHALKWQDNSPITYNQLFQPYNNSKEILVYGLQTSAVTGEFRHKWKTYSLEAYKKWRYPFICKASIDSMKMPSPEALKEHEAKKLLIPAEESPIRESPF